MISCDECQKKIVAVFDSEGSEGDEELISTHIEGCAECRAFQEDTARIGQEFVSIPVARLRSQAGRELIRDVTADRLRNKASSRQDGGSRIAWRTRFRRLAWAGGSIGLLLMFSSCFAVLILAREVADLRRELRLAKRSRDLPTTNSLLANTHENGMPRILSVEETSERLRDLVSLGSHSTMQWPLRSGAVQSSLRFPSGATPEKLAVLAAPWRDQVRVYVEERILMLEEFRKVANPAFDEIIGSYIRALEAYQEGRVRDSIELIQGVEELWEAIDGPGKQRFPGRVLAPHGKSRDVDAARGPGAAGNRC